MAFAKPIVLEEANLWPLRNTPIQCQPPAIQIQLAIINVLLSDPAILLLDEPAQGLNRQEAQFLLSWVKRFAHEHGKTVILATRHIEAIRKQCERVVVLDNGHLVADQPASILDSLFPDQIYQIVLKGYLSDDWSEWFDGLTISHTTNEVTTLSGPLPDQAALHGALIKVRDLGLPLLAVDRVEPDVDEVLRVLTRDR
jgi:ABC-type multidrug transport system ATPase subunit